jgi:hypothetical protein
MYPELRWFHAIPNGGLRDKITANKLKMEGVKGGVADCFLPVKRGQWSGLYIEMKAPKEKPVKADSKGGVKPEQFAFGNFVGSQGFGWIVCYSWEEAVLVLESYLNVDNRTNETIQ